MSKQKTSNPFDGLLTPSDQSDQPVIEPRQAIAKVKGKKSNKDYVPSMTYLPKQLKFDIQQELLNLQRKGVDIDFSELVAELLTLYLDIQKADNSDIQISNYLDTLLSKYSDS
jgi:hypothetical protein